MRRRSLGTVADMPQDSKLGVAGSVPLTKLMALMYPNSPTIRTDMSKFAGAYNGLMAFVNKYIEPGHLPKATVNLLALTAVKGGAKNLTEVRQQSVALARKLIMGSTAERENVRKMIAHMKQLTEIAVARGGLSGRKGSTRQPLISPRVIDVVTSKASRPMASRPMNSMSHQAFIMDHIQDGIQCANFWLKTLDRKRFAKEIVQLTQIRNELSSYLPAPSKMEKFPTISMKPSAPKIGRLPILPPSMVQKKNPLTPQSLYRIEQLIEQLQNLSMRLVQSEMKHLSMVNSQLQGSNKTVTSLKAKIAELETKCEKIANSKSPTESQRLTAKDVVIAKLKSEVASLKKMQSACKQSASVLKKDLRLAEFDLDNLITRDAHPQDIEAKHEEIEAIEKMITQVEDPILVVPEQGVSTTAASEEEEGGFFGDFFGDVGEGIDDIISGGKEIVDTVTKTPEELADEEAALAEEEATRTAANTAGDTKETEESEEESNTMLYVGIGAVLLGGAAWYYTSRNN